MLGLARCCIVVLLKDILFKEMHVGISFKSTIHHLSKSKTTNNKQEQKCVEFTLTCSTCKLSHVRQTSHCHKQRYQTHIRYIKRNDPQSAYMLHILNNNPENGPINTTMTILKPQKPHY